MYYREISKKKGKTIPQYKYNKVNVVMELSK